MKRRLKIAALCLGLFFLSRFLRGGWKSIDLEHDASTDRVPGFEVAPAGK